MVEIYEKNFKKALNVKLTCHVPACKILSQSSSFLDFMSQFIPLLRWFLLMASCP